MQRLAKSIMRIKLGKKLGRLQGEVSMDELGGRKRRKNKARVTKCKFEEEYNLFRQEDEHE